MIRNTYSLDLVFLSPYPLKKDDLPDHAIAQVLVKTLTRDEDGHILITPQCVSLRELEHHINRLKQELDEIRKVAKRKFALHGKREEEWREQYRNRSS